MNPVIPIAEFSQRVRNAQALMTQKGIDVMFAFSNEAEPHNVRYFSDYWPSFETAAVLFGQKGDPILLIGPESMTFAKDRSKISEIRRIKCLRESSNPEYPGEKLDTILEAIQSVAAGKVSKLAVAGYNLAPKIVFDDLEEALRAYPGAEIVRGDDLVMELRKIKSPAEIACLRKAGEITHLAMRYMIENIRPGMTEQQVVGLGIQAIYENGGECEAYPFWSLAGHGSNQAISRPRNKVIGTQDYVHLCAGARYEGYAASVGRGVFFGTPDPWVVDAIKRGYDAEDLVMSELYDGNNAGTVAKKYFDFMAKTGHDKYLLYGPCHATGLMEGEPPWIESISNYTIHENMCYCIDIFMGNPNGLGLRVEDSVRVGKTGGDNYTSFPKEIFKK